MKILPDGYFIILLSLSILFHFLFPVLIIIHFPFNLTGIFLIIIGLAMTLWVNYNLLQAKTALRPFEMPGILIQSGLFKLSRNPLYLGMAIALLGSDILLGSLSPFLFTVVFIIIIDRVFIPVEEKNLEKRFGAGYLNYKKKVRRWI